MSALPNQEGRWARAAGAGWIRPDFAAALAKPGKELGENALNVRPDPPDFRDQYYEPSLVEIHALLDPVDVAASAVRQQGAEGSCTGQALAAVIDIQNVRRRRELLARTVAPIYTPEQVSARMLYEMARAYDEYPDDGLAGSSARGAIKAFFHNGVCCETMAPYEACEVGWHLSVEMAKEARATSLGAYFRLHHVLYDYHAALNEVGALFVTAMVHPGWERPVNGRIAVKETAEVLGAHAFAVIGYDAEGFYVLNSWGPSWGGFDGRPGVAYWSYADWQAHVLDAWVLRLSVPSPSTFHLVGGYQTASSRPAVGSTPRIEINGHYIHVANGRFVESGTFWNAESSFIETAASLRALGPKENGTYSHLLLYAHGGLNDLDAAANRAAAMTPVFKALKIYPVFYLWRTGLLEELADVLLGPAARVHERTQGMGDLIDPLLERCARRIVRPLWTEMKADAARAMVRAARGQGGDGWTATEVLASAAMDAGMALHLVGHSAGAILLGRMLERATASNVALDKAIATVSLLAPACTEGFFKAAYHSVANGLDGRQPRIRVYCLSTERERDDSVGPYRKSLLYLVRNALEKSERASILGIEEVATAVARAGLIDLKLAGGREPDVTDARTHGGFDNDPATLNDILARVLGGPVAPGRGFSTEVLSRSYGNGVGVSSGR